ncbi:protein of unknown function [Nitrospira japonica]|uniref:Insertion element IS150 protein InsJ-like helix-turn-helix domain-containing protein n=1 Tax=Nitrospira japonica TaxID=1325564 RepID=A0A1W1IAD6_9BACT|nr:protein of unknown function [Nitrospira japonica]
MTSRERVIRAKLSILAIAAELKNVAKACRLSGVSRSQYYALRRTLNTQGRDGLAPKIRRKPVMPNRTPALMERQILLKTHSNPTVSYVRLARQMTLDGVSVTPGMVRYVWEREGLSTRSARLRWVKGAKGHIDSPAVALAASVTATSSVSLCGPAECFAQASRCSSAHGSPTK